MGFTKQTNILTHTGALAMLQAAIAKAEELERPQYITIVDHVGVPVVQFKMTGAKFLSRESATSKAVTAASNGAPSADVPEAVRPAIAAATGGAVTGLAGGLPIIIEGELVGGIGIGSGTPDQDLAVARAALQSIGADLFPSS